MKNSTYIFLYVLVFACLTYQCTQPVIDSEQSSTATEATTTTFSNSVCDCPDDLVITESCAACMYNNFEQHRAAYRTAVEKQGFDGFNMDTTSVNQVFGKKIDKHYIFNEDITDAYIMLALEEDKNNKDTYVPGVVIEINYKGQIPTSYYHIEEKFELKKDTSDLGKRQCEQCREQAGSNYEILTACRDCMVDNFNTHKTEFYEYTKNKQRLKGFHVDHEELKQALDEDKDGKLDNVTVSLIFAIRDDIDLTRNEEVYTPELITEIERLGEGNDGSARDFDFTLPCPTTCRPKGK